MDKIAINQFSLRETVGFKDVTLFDAVKSIETFATERFSGEVYRFDQSRPNPTWNLTGLSVVIGNSSDGKYGKIVGFRNTDGTVFSHIQEWQYVQCIVLFWDNHKKYLFRLKTYLEIYFYLTRKL